MIDVLRMMWPDSIRSSGGAGAAVPDSHAMCQCLFSFLLFVTMVCTKNIGMY